MPQLTSNFILRSKQPNFERDSFKTIEEMRAVPSSWMDEGHISYCEQDGQYYKFKSIKIIDGTKIEINENAQESRWSLLIPAVDNITQDIFTVSSIKDLNDNYAKQIDCGKLVYVKEKNRLFFNAYDKKNESGVQYNDYLENKTGWFHPLVSNEDFDTYINNTFVKYGYCENEKDQEGKNTGIINSLSTSFATKNELGLASVQPSEDDTEAYRYISLVDYIQKNYTSSTYVNGQISSLTDDLNTTKNEIGLASVQPSEEEEEAQRYTSVVDYMQKNYALSASVNGQISSLTQSIDTLILTLEEKYDGIIEELKDKIEELEDKIEKLTPNPTQV